MLTSFENGPFTKIYAPALINIQVSIDPLLLNLDELDGSKVKEPNNWVKIKQSQVDDHTEGCRLVSASATPEYNTVWKDVDDESTGTIC